MDNRMIKRMFDESESENENRYCILSPSGVV